MKESTTYQAIIEEGRTEGKALGIMEGRILELRKTILQLGTIRFGMPTPQAQRTLSRIKSITRLEKMTEALLRVSSWEELFAP